MCCNIAAYNCGGNAYYCMYCHDRKGPQGKVCNSKEDCPLGVDHPKNRTSFGVGCGMCKELKIADFEKAMKEEAEKRKEKEKNILDF